ncbi:MAG: BACON domain-containing protein, partial [Candidatus Cryptobacteroides sp.]
MKRIFEHISIIAAVAGGLFATAACQEFSIDSQADAPLKIETDVLDSYEVMAVSPSRVVFNISSNTPWRITTDSQWCKATPSMSATSSLVSEVEIIAEEYEGRQARTATFSIAADGIGEIRTFTVTQASKQNLTVVPFDERLATEGQAFSFSIVSNKAWEIIPSTSFLSDIDKKSGEGSENGAEEVITVNVPANPGAVRSGQLTVKTDYDSYTFTVTQNGVIIELEENPESNVIEFEMGDTSKEKVVKIRSNKEWKVQVPEEYAGWLSAEKTADGDLKITVGDNHTLQPLTGEIILTTVDIIDGFDGVTFVVTNPNLMFDITGGCNLGYDEATGATKIKIQNGELVASKFLIKKGRTTIEYAGISASATAKFGMGFTSPTSAANYKLHLEAGTYWYRCAGGFGWIAPIKKAEADFMPLADFRKVEFVV